MAKVLLIQPPLAERELFARGARASASVIPPLGLAYIAAYLLERGHECRIIDGIAEPMDFVEVIAAARGFDVVGVTVVSTYAMRAMEVVRALKAAGINAPVIAGGPHVTALPESMLEAGADFCVAGEGERTTLELIEKLAAGARPADLANVRGIAFLDSGKYVFTGRREPIEPLDEVPPPARQLLPMHRYRSSIARASRQPSHSMLAARGCTGVCSFCNKMTFGTKVRYFSPERIIGEFFTLRDRYRANDVAVWDDNFMRDRETVSRVCEGLRKQKFGRTWSVEARVDDVSAEALREMKSAGCTYIALGIESGSGRVLEHIKKKITKDDVRRAVKMCSDAGIAIRGYFMMGLPSETPDEMEETIRFAVELDIDVASFTLFVPLPGTLEFRRAAAAGAFDPDYFKHRIVPEFNFLDKPVYVPEGMTEQQLLAIHRSAYKRYYFRPKIIMRKLASLRSPGEIISLFKGGLTLLVDMLRR